MFFFIVRVYHSFSFAKSIIWGLWLWVCVIKFIYILPFTRVIFMSISINLCRFLITRVYVWCGCEGECLCDYVLCVCIIKLICVVLITRLILYLFSKFCIVNIYKSDGTYMYFCIFKVDSSENKDTVVDMPVVQTAQQLSAVHLPGARRYIYIYIYILIDN